MFGKLKTKHLVLLLILLAGVWWASGLFSPRAQQRTFREELLRIDTNTINSFTFQPAPYKHLPPLRFERRPDGWMMFLATDSSKADPAPIHDLFRSWKHLRVNRMAGRMADVATRYDLTDSTAEHLTIEAAGQRYGLRVGRHTAGEGPVTLVSPPGDDQVYAVDGLLGFYADYTYGDWLPKYLVTGDPQNWKRLTFNFPDGIGYVIERTGDRWTMDGVPLDPERTDRFLRSLSKAKGQSAADPADTLVAVPRFRLVVEDTTRTSPIVVIVFSSNGKFIVRSSLNPGSVMPFDGKQEVARMFRPREAFLPH